MKLKIQILFILITSLSSCSTFRKSVNNKNSIKLTVENRKLINGKYAVKSLLNKDSIQGDLYGNIFDRGYNKKNAVKFIELKVIEDQKILVNLYDGDSIVRSKIFKGKYKKGYFQFKRRWLVIPGIFLNIYRNRMFRIGLLENGNIITDHNQISLGTGFFIIPFYEYKKVMNIEFKRLEE